MSASQHGSPASHPPKTATVSLGAWSDPGFALVALTAVGLGVWTSLRVEGALFADVVEYLERARALVAGEELIDAQKVRAAGVTALHAPALWLAALTGAPESHWILTYAAVVHGALSICLLLATRRLAIAIGTTRKVQDRVQWSLSVGREESYELAPRESGLARSLGVAESRTAGF